MISEEHIQEPVVVSDVAGETLLGLLRWWVEQRPSELIYTFLPENGAGAERLTYAALDREARAIAQLLRESGAYGQPVLLVLPPGLQFVSAFFGCLYAGAIATPAYPPASEKNAIRLASIVADARPPVGLTTSYIMNSRRPSVAELFTDASIRWLTVDALEDGRADDWRPPHVEAYTPALLQYTSGSTAAPKGVMITHANLLHNQSLIQRAFGQNEESVTVSWLPLYHDMGLIGAVLQPLYVGAECVLLPSISFLQRPVRWLEVISEYRATTSGGPNFAFDLCARKVTAEQKQNLDLSSWSVAFTGAEPVIAETLDRFASEFAECGFNPKAFQPCYGLAEATLLVSAAGADRPYIREADARALELNRVEEPTSHATASRSQLRTPPPADLSQAARRSPDRP
jgi:acyl-CoA synthetase (AMP-forming)/AMP-acid ligase II